MQLFSREKNKLKGQRQKSAMRDSKVHEAKTDRGKSVRDKVRNVIVG